VQQVVIALGSNVADPVAALQLAWRCVCHEAGIERSELSHVRRTEPAEDATGPLFANAVGVGWTVQSPTQLLETLHKIERNFGRARVTEGHHGARPLDLDLIDHGGAIVATDALQLPHPAAATRDFVIGPLAELRPTWRHPVLGTTAAALLSSIMVLLVAGCSHPPAPPNPWSPVSTPSEPPALALRVATVTNSAMLNEFYEALVAYEGAKFCAEAMLTAAGRMTDEELSTLPGARLIAAHAVYRIVQARALGDHFKEIRKLVDRLHQASPKSPSTRFSLAYLRWILMATGDGRLRANELDRSVIVDLEANLNALATDTPTYDGPGEFDRGRIVRARNSVRRLLADLPTPAPVAMPPAEATSTQ
jgi:2-amino-4-hydroxy-6-hydroxymethyldihydropteridine diphosphokinase